MDPLAAVVALATLATRILDFAEMVWKATPPEQQRELAAVNAQISINISKAVLEGQAQMRALLKLA